MSLSVVEGAAVIVEGRFKSPAGAEVDPDIVEVTIAEPDGVTITKTRAAGELDNPQVGTWQYVYEALKPGRVKYDIYGLTESEPISAERGVGEFGVMKRR